MPIPRKKNFLKRLFEEPFLYDIVVAISAAIAAIYGGINYFKTNKPEAMVIFASAGVVCLFTCLKHIAAFIKTSKQESIHELDGCLHTLHSALHLTLPEGENAILRITIHVPAEGGQELEQVTDYVIDYADSKKTAGRKIPSQSGIAGEAFRMKQTLQGERVEDDYEKYIKELVDVWHYVEADARKCNPATKSWLAIPLLETANNQNVEGVIYFDCNKNNFFSPERQQIAINAASGIAKFIGKRYSS